MCTKHLDRFFTNVSDLKEACIDSVYDACEDPVSDVRKEGYRAIGRFSEKDLSLVRRNTDVLVQLLQSDDPSELEIIKEVLAYHLHLDAAASLQVLCDSCSPSSSSAAEDPADREQLRNLVLEFLTNSKNPVVRGRLRSLDEETERGFLVGLCRAIPFCTAEQTEALTNEIFLKSKILFSSEELSNILISSLASQIDRLLEARTGKPRNISSLVKVVESSDSIIQKLPKCNPLPVTSRLCHGVLDRIRASIPIAQQKNLKSLLMHLFAIVSMTLTFDTFDKTDKAWSNCIEKLINDCPEILPT